MSSWEFKEPFFLAAANRKAAGVFGYVEGEVKKEIRQVWLE